MTLIKPMAKPKLTPPAARLVMQVHGANPMAAKHPRNLLCQSCHAEPATVVCKVERLMMCDICDMQAHASSDGGDHIRSHLAPFTVRAPPSPASGKTRCCMSSRDVGSSDNPHRQWHEGGAAASMAYEPTPHS